MLKSHGASLGILLLVVASAQALTAQEVPSAANTGTLEEARVLHYSGSRESSDRAVALLEEYLRTSPRDTTALVALGDIYLSRGTRFDTRTIGMREFQAAAGIAHQLIPLSQARGHELLGRSYLLRGEHSFARAEFNRGLEFAPDDIELRAYLAHCYFQMGEHHRAIPEAERVVSVDPNHYMLLIRAFSLFHLGLLDSLEAVFERSIAVDPQGQGYGGLHLVSLARGNDEAVAVAERIVAERPEWAQAYAYAGHAHYFAGNDVEAIRYLEEAVRLSPDAHVHYTVRSATTPLAALYLKQGRDEEAAGLLEHAERGADLRLYLGREPWNSYYQYAGIALMRGDRAGALRWLETALIEGMPGPVLIERDPLLAELRGDPGFEDIVDRLRARRDEIQERLGLR